VIYFPHFTVVYFVVCKRYDEIKMFIQAGIYLSTLSLSLWST